jgi:hypothetical protein
MKDLFCTISQDGGLFTRCYMTGEMEGNTIHHTGAHCQGYSLETFTNTNPGTPLIDYRTADPAKVIRAIMATDGPAEHYGHGVTLREYLNTMEKTGATITTVGQAMEARQYEAA